VRGFRNILYSSSSWAPKSPLQLHKEELISFNPETLDKLEEPEVAEARWLQPIVPPTPCKNSASLTSPLPTIMSCRSRTGRKRKKTMATTPSSP